MLLYSYSTLRVHYDREAVVIVAKKKKRRKKRRSSYPRVNSGNNSHHLLWQRRRWDCGAVKALRSYHYCIIDIPANTLHREIHENINQIPPPSQENARRVLWHIQYLERFGGISERDPIEKRLKVLIALFDCSEQPTADALRKQLEIVNGLKKAP